MLDIVVAIGCVTVAAEPWLMVARLYWRTRRR